MNFKRINQFAVALVLTCFAAVNANAIPVVDIVSWQDTFAQDEVLGWAFTANDDMTITHLGNFDATQNGLSGDFEVGLWDSSGALLASTVVSGNTGILEGFFWYEQISAVNLLAGNDYVVASYGLGGAVNVSFQGVIANVDPIITQTTGLFEFCTSLCFPTELSAAEPYYAASFQYGAAAVSEPGLLALLGIGLLGIGLSRRMS